MKSKVDDLKTTWRDELIAEFRDEVPGVHRMENKELQRLLPAILSREE